MVRLQNLRSAAVAVGPSGLAGESAAHTTASTPFDLYALYTHQERQEVLLRFFRDIGLHSLRGKRMFDVGCGSGGHLRRMVDFGAEPANCFGIDPSTKSIEAARKLNPNMKFIEGSADRLAFADE
jgi:ubiquinone/menaquinone biosynthesis C-methylase UbiE